LVVDSNRFPRGLAYVSDSAHARGLKFGVYVSAGNTTCSGYAGSWGHWAADADTAVHEWRADFVKMDACGLDSDVERGAAQRAVAYPALSAALAATGRAVTYSCDADELLRDVNNTERPWLWAPGVCDMWRVSPDAKDDWGHVVERVDASPNLDAFAGPARGYN